MKNSLLILLVIGGLVLILGAVLKIPIFDLVIKNVFVEKGDDIAPFASCQPYRATCPPTGFKECLENKWSELNTTCRFNLLEASCAGDRLRFCKDTKAGNSSVWNCLAQQKDLSNPCAHFTQQIVLGWDKACGEDYMQFCSTVNPGENRINECLIKNRKKISANCRTLLSWKEDPLNP